MTLLRGRLGTTPFTLLPVRVPHLARAFHDFGGNEDRLPVDQHLLIAAIAPRPVLVTSARLDWWSDPEGELLGPAGAAPAYELLGASGGLDATWMPPLGQLVGGRLGYFIRAGGHAIGEGDWRAALDFADAQLGRRD